MLTIEKFNAAWQDIKPGQTGAVLLAVSGGLDSMTMTTLFRSAGIPFAVGHCNFKLRGADSDGDEQFIREWCEANGVSFHTISFDTKTIAASDKTGIQEAARNLRYRWLKETCRTHNYTAICTAHHQDDNVETVLMNLARGTGIAGLHGIRIKHGQLLRPLLFTSRKEIEAYAAEHKIAFREDASNKGDDYTRNAIRHRVLPVLEEIMPGAAKRIHETAQRIAEAEVLYRQAIDRERKKLIEPRGKDHYIPVRLLQHRVPLHTITFELLQPFGFTAAQTAEVLQLLKAESGRYVASPTHRILRNRDFLIITATAAEAADLFTVDVIPGEIITPEGTFRISESALPPQLDNGADTCYLDLNKIEQPVILRRWKTGDYFYPLGMGGKKKKLSRFFIDQKISVHEKEKIWVLESNRRIAWVCGHRMDERFKITTATKAVLKVKFSKP